jgi:hypothetical protein
MRPSHSSPRSVEKFLRKSNISRSQMPAQSNDSIRRNNLAGIDEPVTASTSAQNGAAHSNPCTAARSRGGRGPNTCSMIT